MTLWGEPKFVNCDLLMSTLHALVLAAGAYKQANI